MCSGVKRPIAATCTYGRKLEEQLRNHFVLVLKDESTQKIILALRKFNFIKVLDIAFARKTADVMLEL